MGDNDFPIAMAGQGGSPYEEFDPEMLRRMRQPATAPAGGFKEFLKQYLPKVPGTQKPQGYFREELEGERSYSQAGTDIPDFGIQQAYEQREGGPVFEQMVAGSPSFDLRFPKMPGNQDVEGIPNASPEMLRKFVERKLKNPSGGQELPGFLKKASAEEGADLFAGAFGIPDDIIEKRKTLQEMINKPGYPDDVRRKAQQEWIQLMKQSQVRGA